MASFEEETWIIQQIRQNFFDGRIRDNGRDLNFRCPFCGDSKKNKSKARAHFYRESCSFYCFNCGHSDTGFGLVAKLKNTTTKTVKKEFFLSCKNDNTLKDAIATEFLLKKPIKLEKQEPIKQKLIQPTWVDIDDTCYQYLDNRKIFDAPGIDKRFKFYLDTMTTRLVIPWYNKGEIMYYQLRSLNPKQQPKYLFPSGIKKKTYGFDKIDENVSFICYTEGILDAIFVKNCLAIGGLKPTIEQEKEIKANAYNKDIIWISDNYWIDEASRKAILDKAKTNPKQLIFCWDKNCKCKDINELICEQNNPKLFWDEHFIRTNIKTVGQIKIQLAFTFK